MLERKIFAKIQMMKIHLSFVNANNKNHSRIYDMLGFVRGCYNIQNNHVEFYRC